MQFGVVVEEIRRRLIEDLSDVVEGEIRVDRAVRAAYSTDASLYEVEPVAVIFPRTTADIEAIAQWSADAR
ncbi:MAG: FAD-binding oxidoreductase, partial [Planctomycetaceae bacterium]|nr:FAD-binding oxidoreductase [Planctomycetaceae bacterium]